MAKWEIDEELHRGIPRLSEESFKELERSCLKEGIRNKGVLWRGLVLDGRHRAEIAKKHSLDIQFLDYSDRFESWEEARLWVLSNLSAERHLTEIEKSKLRAMKYRLEKELEVNKGETETAILEKVGEGFEVSYKTIERDSALLDAIENLEEAVSDSTIIRRIESGEIKAEKKTIIDLSKKCEDEIFEALEPIRRGQTKELSKSIKMSNARVEYPALKREEESFCSLYAKKGLKDSLKCFQESRKHIEKVRASQELQKIYIWKRILEEVQEKRDVSEYTNSVANMVEYYNDTHDTPWYQAYEKLIRHTSGAVNHRTVNMTVDLFRLWELLQRPKFMKECQDALKHYMERVDVLSQGNRVHWQLERAKFSKNISGILETKINLN